MRALLLYFLKLGALGFGGPIALAGYMQRDLVDARGWIDRSDYDEALAFAQLSPGPLAAQLAIYLGWLRGRVLGAALVSAAFVGPSFVMVLALSAYYVAYGGLPWMQGAFYGISGAVVAIIGRSSFNLLKKTLENDRLLWTMAVVTAAVTAITGAEPIWLVVLGGVASIVFRGPPTPRAAMMMPMPLILLTGLHGAATTGMLLKVLLYFGTAGLFVLVAASRLCPSSTAVWWTSTNG